VCSFNPDPRGLASAQGQQSASNAYDQGITERHVLRHGDFFAGGKTKIEQSGAILPRAVETFDAYALV
jgi:hypothetical protein